MARKRFKKLITRRADDYDRTFRYMEIFNTIIDDGYIMAKIYHNLDESWTSDINRSHAALSSDSSTSSSSSYSSSSSSASYRRKLFIGKLLPANSSMMPSTSSSTIVRALSSSSSSLSSSSVQPTLSRMIALLLWILTSLNYAVPRRAKRLLNFQRQQKERKSIH